MDLFQRIMEMDLGVIPTKNTLEAPAAVSNGSLYEPLNNKKSEKLIFEISKRGFNVEPMIPILKTEGNQLVISGAGSGKTTNLIFLLLYKQTTGELTTTQEVNGRSLRVMDSVLVSTFLKSGAEELRERYRSWANALGVPDMSQYIKFSTLHAEFKSCLNQLGIDTNIILDSDNRKLLRSVVKDVMQYSNTRLNADQLTELETALTRTRNMIRGEDKYSNPTYDDFGMSPMVVESILKGWKAEREKKGVVDFEDLQEILYHLLYNREDPTALEFVANRYSYLFLDEFQDTSAIQYEILKKYMEGAKSTVAIGDDDQTIYSWRGSSSDIITTHISKDFPLTQNSLVLNYRCPSGILDAVIPSINRNENRFKKSLESARDGGSLKVGSFGSAIDMGKSLVEQIKNDTDRGLKSSVLGRTNMDLFLPALMLSQDGSIPFSLSSLGMTFENSIGRVAKSIPYILTRKTGTQVSTALKSLVWDKTEVDKLMRVCKQEGVFFVELDNEDLRYSIPQLYPHLMQLKDMISNDEIESLLRIYRYFMQDAARSSSTYSRNLYGVLSSVHEFIQANKYTSAREVSYELGELAEELKYRVREPNKQDMVRLATVHEYKGKESPSVYIWNDSEGSFPHVRSNTPETIEEERRLHYIAVTRAKEQLTIMFQSGKMSPFLEEMDLSNAERLKVVRSLRI